MLFFEISKDFPQLFPNFFPVNDGHVARPTKRDIVIASRVENDTQSLVTISKVFWEIRSPFSAYLLGGRFDCPSPCSKEGEFQDAALT
jgi:hypothetical protein